MFVTLTVLCVLLYCIYVVTTSKFDYWKKRNVPFKKPVPLLGNYTDYLLFRKYFGDVAEELCYKFADEPYFGTFYGTEPALVVLNPEYLKLIFTKDFYYFNYREVTKYNDKELLTRSLFNQGGDKWKTIRQNMTAIFSSAKMKNMFYLIEKCTQDLEKLTDIEFAKSRNNVIETKILKTRYTIACIGSCVFGVETGTMDELANLDDNVFMQVANVSNYPTYKQIFKTYVRAIWPSVFYAFGGKLLPPHMCNYFRDLLTNVFKSRGYKPSSRQDFVDLLLGFHKKKYITGDCMSNSITGEHKKYQLEVNDELLIAQCLILFLAGFETSAVSSSFLLFELAKKPEALKRCQAEVDSYLARHNNRLTYDCLAELPYLDACLDETLRLYPALGVIPREVAQDYTLPTGLVLEKGLRIHIPCQYMQKSPKHFDNPLEFCPDRFLGDNKKKINPYTYFPFGEGPRICIGLRFGKMQNVPGIITILKKFDLEVADGMPLRPKIDPKTFIIQSQEGILLKYTLREGWEKRVYTTLAAPRGFTRVVPVPVGILG